LASPALGSSCPANQESSAKADKEHKTPGWAIFLFICFALVLLGQRDRGSGGSTSHEVEREPSKHEAFGDAITAAETPHSRDFFTPVR